MKKPNLFTVILLLLVILLSVVINSCREKDMTDFQPYKVIIIDDNTIFLDPVNGLKGYTLRVENAYGIDEHLIYMK